MNALDLSAQRASTLLELHSAIMQELRERGVVRTSNSPSGDYAETLFHKAFGWTLERNSSAGFDAIDGEGTRFQIKCRRVTRHNNSRQLGAIRNLESNGFDCLAGVIFNEDYSVYRAVIIPSPLLSKMTSRYSKHVNAWLYQLRDDVWDIAGIRDVTNELRQAAAKL